MIENEYSCISFVWVCVYAHTHTHTERLTHDAQCHNAHGEIRGQPLVLVFVFYLV